MKTNSTNTQTPAFNVGDQATVAGELVTIVSYAKGWFGVQDAAGDEWSVRAAQLSAPQLPKAAKLSQAELDEMRQLLTADDEAADDQDDEQDDEPAVVVHRIGQRVVRRFHLYERTKSATGHSSRDTADNTALALRGLTLDQIYAEAARVLVVPEDALRAKYAKLNPGMQRMNLGNRIRATQARRAEGLSV
jgi:hypothetical protein